MTECVSPFPAKLSTITQTMGERQAMTPTVVSRSCSQENRDMQTKVRMAEVTKITFIARYSRQARIFLLNEEVMHSV